MFYTDQPLNTQKTRVLVNLDIDSISGALSPRKGFITKDIYQFADIRKDYTRIFQDVWGEFCVSVFNAENNANQNAVSLIYLQKLDNASEQRGATLRSDGYTYPGVIFQGRYHYTVREFERLTTGSFREIVKYYSVDLLEFYTHGLTNAQVEYSPRILNPTEAYNWGYNMLAEDPYAFACVKQNNLEILGVAPYEVKGTQDVIQLNPRINQNIKFKAYYGAPANWKSDARITRTVTPNIITTVKSVTNLPDPKDKALKEGDAYLINPALDNPSKQVEIYPRTAQAIPLTVGENTDKITRSYLQTTDISSTEIGDLFDYFINRAPEQDTISIKYRYRYVKEVSPATTPGAVTYQATNEYSDIGVLKLRGRKIRAAGASGELWQGTTAFTPKYSMSPAFPWMESSAFTVVTTLATSHPALKLTNGWQVKVGGHILNCTYYYTVEATNTDPIQVYFLCEGTDVMADYPQLMMWLRVTPSTGQIAIGSLTTSASYVGDAVKVDITKVSNTSVTTTYYNLGSYASKESIPSSDIPWTNDVSTYNVDYIQFAHYVSSGTNTEDWTLGKNSMYTGYMQLNFEETHASTTGLLTFSLSALKNQQSLPKGFLELLDFQILEISRMSDGYVFYNYTWYPHEDIIQGEPIPIKLATATSNTDPLIARWEWREATSSDWVVIKEETETFPTDNAGNYLPLTCDLSLSTENSIIRLSLFDAILKEKDTQNEIINKRLASTTIGITAITTQTEQKTNIVNTVNYDLSLPMKQLSWGNRLVKYYGISDVRFSHGDKYNDVRVAPEFSSLLFVSAVNAPDYFPYPNSVDTFDEPIVGCANYGDDLLVFTKAKLYRLTYNTSDQGWTKSLIQDKFSIDTVRETIEVRNKDIKTLNVDPDYQFGKVSCETQTMLYTPIRQYAAYRSNKRIFMILPSKNGTGNVTLAPISNAIKELLDPIELRPGVVNSSERNPLKEILKQILKITIRSGTLADYGISNYTSKMWLHADYNNIIYSLIYSVYYANTTHDICVQLRYNIDLYSWTVYMFELHGSDVRPVYHANTKTLYYDTYRVLGDGDTRQLLSFRCVQDIQNIKDECEVPTGVDPLKYIMKNYQYFDTGNREINSDIRKRFREWQLKFVNPEVTTLQFYTNFYIDNRLRNTFQGLETSTKNTADGDGFEVIINETYTPNATYVPNVRIASGAILTSPDPDAEDLTESSSSVILDNVDAWEIGLSSFDTVPFIKVRKPVSGKGYTPRLVIFSFNEKRWELLNCTWVYRTMTSD
jgi:hypothetical protein